MDDTYTNPVTGQTLCTQCGDKYAEPHACRGRLHERVCELESKLAYANVCIKALEGVVERLQGICARIEPMR